MTEKYIDLADRIAEDFPPMTGPDIATLRWLDEHTDQVPGRTMTESEFHEAADAHRNGGLGWRDLADSLGITVVPGPEPTSSLQMFADLEELTGDGFLLTGRHLEKIAKHLTALGWTKAPVGDDD